MGYTDTSKKPKRVAVFSKYGPSSLACMLRTLIASTGEFYNLVSSRDYPSAGELVILEQVPNSDFGQRWRIVTEDQPE